MTDHGPAYAGIRAAADSAPEVGGLALDDQPPRPGGPLVLLVSVDLDATLSSVEAAGGQVTQGPYPFPGGRRFHFAAPPAASWACGPTAEPPGADTPVPTVG